MSPIFCPTTGRQDLLRRHWAFLAGFRVEGSASWAARHGTGHGTGHGQGMGKMSMGKPMEIHGRSMEDRDLMRDLWSEIYGTSMEIMGI